MRLWWKSQMAKADPVSIRSIQLELTHIANFYTDLKEALELYYSGVSPKFVFRFAAIYRSRYLSSILIGWMSLISRAR